MNQYNRMLTVATYRKQWRDQMTALGLTPAEVLEYFWCYFRNLLATDGSMCVCRDSSAAHGKGDHCRFIKEINVAQNNRNWLLWLWSLTHTVMGWPQGTRGRVTPANNRGKSKMVFEHETEVRELARAIKARGWMPMKTKQLNNMCKAAAATYNDWRSVGKMNTGTDPAVTKPCALLTCTRCPY